MAGALVSHNLHGYVPAMNNPANPLYPNAGNFAPLPAEKKERCSTFPGSRPEWFPGLLGIVLEEVRVDYARMRLPFRPVLNQPQGVMHGGATASLIDSVVVPAIGSGYDEPRRMMTIDMQIQYLGAIVSEDAVAEGWTTKRGRSTVFCRAEVRTESAGLVATGTLVYKVSKA